MKNKGKKTALLYIVFALSAAQILYFTIYSFLTRDSENGIFSLFILILAIEFFILLVYSFMTFSRIVDSIVKGISYIKNPAERKSLGVGLAEVDDAISSVIEYYEDEKNRAAKKRQIMIACMENPVASELLKKELPTILDITGANACCYYYVNNGTGRLELMESYGFGKELYKAMDINIGEGLEGLCCKREKTCILSEENAEIKYVSPSSYGKESFKNVIAVPIIGKDEGCVGVMTLAFKGDVSKKNIEDAEELAKFFSPVHYNNLRYEKYKRQTEELELQNNLIQDINHELGIRNSELEKRIKALKD